MFGMGNCFDLSRLPHRLAHAHDCAPGVPLSRRHRGLLAWALYSCYPRRAAGVGPCRYGLPMTSDTLRDTVAHLAARIESLSNLRFGNLTFATKRYPDWAEGALARVAIVVGAVDRIHYSTGVLKQSEDMKTYFVEVLVITDDVIVHGEFSTARDRLQPEGSVVAWRRSKLEHVNVGQVWPADPEAYSEEGQSGSAEATLVMTGGVEIQVPSRRESPRTWDSELLRFLPELLRS
jgi:hypothetical protein